MAYGDIGEAAAYAALNGYAVSLSPMMINRASNVLDAIYGSLFLGKAVTVDAAWPRSGIPGVSPLDVPKRVREATYELAIMEAQNSGALTTLLNNARQSPVIREKAGDVEIAYADPTKSYGFSMAQFGRPAYIDGLLSPFLRSEMPEPAVYVV